MIYVGGGGLGLGGPLLAAVTALGPWAMEKLFSLVGPSGPDQGVVRADQVMQEFPDFAISVMQQMGMDTSQMTPGGNWAENAKRAGMDPAYVMQYAQSSISGINWSGLEEEYRQQQAAQDGGSGQTDPEPDPDQPPDYSIDHTEPGVDDGPQPPPDWYGPTTPPVDVPSSIPTPPPVSARRPSTGGVISGGRVRGSGGESNPTPPVIDPINPPALPPIDTWTPNGPQPEPPSSVATQPTEPTDTTTEDPVDTTPPATTTGTTEKPTTGRGGTLGMGDWFKTLITSIPTILKTMGIGAGSNPGSTTSPGLPGSTPSTSTSQPASEWEKGLLAILGPLAGALANTEAARTGKSSQSTTTTSSNTTKQNLTPQQQALMDQVAQLSSSYMSDPSKAVEPLRAPGYAAINKNYSGAPQAIADKTLAFGGQSGKFGKAIQASEMGRMNDLSGFEGTLANTAYQGQQAAATRAAGLATTNLGSTIDSTNTSDMTGENINPGSAVGGAAAGGVSALTSIMILDQLGKLGKLPGSTPSTSTTVPTSSAPGGTSTSNIDWGPLSEFMSQYA